MATTYSTRCRCKRWCLKLRSRSSGDEGVEMMEVGPIGMAEWWNITGWTNGRRARDCISAFSGVSLLAYNHGLQEACARVSVQSVQRVHCGATGKEVAFSALAQCEKRRLIVASAECTKY